MPATAVTGARLPVLWNRALYLKREGAGSKVELETARVMIHNL